MSGIDFGKRYFDANGAPYARFCPAISEMYVRFIGNKNPKRPMPAGLVQQDLNFLEPSCKLYHIPYSLYSAGQAAKSDNMAVKKDMINDRDRSKDEKGNPLTNIIVGDSGGFQIQTNAIKFKGDATRERMMRWLERTCDWSMILDFPVGGIGAETADAHVDRLNKELAVTPYVMDTPELKATIHSVEQFCELLGFGATGWQKKPYAMCLLQTMINNDYFVKHRKPSGTEGATKFLNVIQGRNEEESELWYRHVRHYPFDAWSLASHHKENFNMTISRIIQMRDDGLLNNKDWMHILGVGKLANGCIYSTMQRCIREDVNPNFILSYDVSSPFTTTAFGNLFMGYTLDKSAWTLQSGWVDGREYLPGAPKAGVPFLEELRRKWDEKIRLEQNFDRGGNSRFIETEVGKYLKMGDICVNEDPDLTSTWDVVTYALLMNHNLQVHLTGVFEAQDLYDKGDADHVPSEYLELRDLIPRIFASETPYDLIGKNTTLLNCLASEQASAGVPTLELFAGESIADYGRAKERVKEANKSKLVVKKVDNDLWA